MGRKIPGKKHRKIVDPEKQKAVREASLKGKTNNPPKNPDDQEVPKSILEIIKLKNNASFTTEKRKKKKRGKLVEKPLCVEQFLDKDEIQPGMKKPEKYIPNLIQRPEESTEGFLRRVNSMTQKLIKEVQFEDKFGVKIKKDMETGKILKVETDKERKCRKNQKNKSKKISLDQKRKEKKLKKKSEEDGKDFSQLIDVVEFGEVVHRPPLNLKVPKKMTEIDSTNSNKYKHLLLQDLLKNKNKSNKNPIELEKEEKQRQFIVNAYREKKKLQRKISK